ncbi:MAG: hypothetical protein HY587_06845 [Candidatus Omnitrophica bacterium]|nr:hypothetical protein [Candidatus Omnitrophota bacterium]
MNASEVERYFKMLSRRFSGHCEIILTGAAAGILYANIRGTMDLDFAVRFKTRSALRKERLWKEFERATKEATLGTGIAVQYAEDIDHWSLISFLDYRKQSMLFRHFGNIEVRILHPTHWSIGKLTRYLSLDIRDLIQVLKKTRTPWQKEVCLLGKALRKSPRSTASFLFRKHVEHFLLAYGIRVWGKHFDAKQAVSDFRNAAGIRDQAD